MSLEERKFSVITDLLTKQCSFEKPSLRAYNLNKHPKISEVYEKWFNFANSSKLLIGIMGTNSKVVKSQFLLIRSIICIGKFMQLAVRPTLAPILLSKYNEYI